MSKEDKEKIAKLNQSEIIDMVKKGEIVIPSDDKQEFFNFTAKTPEERLKEINGDTAGTPDVPATPPVSEESEKGGEGTQSQAAGGSDPWWKEMGYTDEVKVKETHKSLLDNVARLQSQVDQLNAKGGKTGQELKKIKELNTELEKKVAELSKEPEIQRPERPKRPKISDYEDGQLDEKYIRDIEAYSDSLESYEEQREQYDLHSRKKEFAAVKSEIIKEVPRNEDKTDGLGKLFNVDIPEFQNRFNLHTTVTVKDINDAVQMSQSNDATIRNEGNRRLSLLPPKDKEIFTKIQQAVATAYDGLMDGNPVLRYKSIEGALFDNNLLGEGKLFNYVKNTNQLLPEEEKVLIEKKRKENEQFVNATPAAGATSTDIPPSSGQTADEKKKRYLDLNDIYNMALGRGVKARDQFEASPEYEEWSKLKLELTGRRARIDS